MPVLREVSEEWNESLSQYEAHLRHALDNLPKQPKVAYRKLAFAHYGKLSGQLACALCGFGIRDVLEVAHLDCNRANNDMSNLAILCPNCHKMHDLNLIPTDVIVQMRDQPRLRIGQSA